VLPNVRGNERRPNYSILSSTRVEIQFVISVQRDSIEPKFYSFEISMRTFVLPNVRGGNERRPNYSILSSTRVEIQFVISVQRDSIEPKFYSFEISMRTFVLPNVKRK
jgi:hypothetical protein